MKDKW